MILLTSYRTKNKCCQNIKQNCTEVHIQSVHPARLLVCLVSLSLCLSPGSSQVSILNFYLPQFDLLSPPQFFVWKTPFCHL